MDWRLGAAGHFFGYKIDAAVDVATGLPIAWDVRTAKHHEHEFAIPLVRRVKARGLDVQTTTMDRGYDTEHIHGWCNELGVAPIIPLRETAGVKAGKAEPPHCGHGEWTFAGADYKRQATTWRCPTGECGANPMWLKADRLHPLIPRETKRYNEPSRVSRRLETRISVLERGTPFHMPRARKYPEELLERGARLVFESGRPIAHVAADLGVHPRGVA